MMSYSNTANPVEAVQTVASGQHKLKAEHHPASYYDESSSHYKGGAHNVLIDLVKSGNYQAAPKPEYEFGHNAIVNVAKQLKSGKAPLPSQ